MIKRKLADDESPLMNKVNYDEAVDKTLTSLANESRYDFTYSVFHHPKGVLLQKFIKPLITGVIFYIHDQIQKRYDKDAFVFDDQRLSYVQDFARVYCKENMEERKAKIVLAMLDIDLFFLKEDVFYRGRALDSVNKFTGMTIFRLDPIEKRNLREWKGK